MNERIKAQDPVGEATLNAINIANKFNRWMYETIKPHCKGKVLEVGSGIGNMSNYFIEDGFQIMLTDIQKGYCQQLVNLYKDNTSVLGTKHMDISAMDFDLHFKDQFNTYDTVFALNVIEHIENDNQAIKNCYKLLKEGGKLIILVPSYQILHNEFDVGLGHHRRYNTKTLSKIFTNNNFTIKHKQYFNFMGIFGWFVSGFILRNKAIPDDHMKLYNIFVPIFKIIDQLLFSRAGLSTIVVGEKK